MDILKPLLFIVAGIFILAIGRGIKKDDSGLPKDSNTESNEILKNNKKYSIRFRVAGILSILAGLYFLIIKMF